MRLAYLICCAALLPLVASAAEPVKPKAAPPSADAPPPPPLPRRDSTAAPATESGLEPEVTITTRGEVTHEEYRLNGKLYMIKVVPKQGKPYYLIDREGSGQFQRSDMETRLSIPNWVIKRW
jgi:hypothetical protein